MEPAIKPAGALGCRAVIREVAPGGTYTSAPMLVCSSVYPVLCSTNAPERDVLRRSPRSGTIPVPSASLSADAGSG